MKKPKQVLRKKEELLAELKLNSKFLEKMKFTKEKLWPALGGATTSIDDALQNLSIINSVIMEKFLSLMKDKKMSEIDIFTNLDPKDPQYEGLSTMLHLFDDMTIFDTRDFLEGVRNEINLFLSEENKNRKLSDLRPQWLDEI